MGLRSKRKLLHGLLSAVVLCLLIAPHAHAEPQTQVAYQTDFTKPIDQKHWSHTALDTYTAQNQKRHRLGPFGNDTVLLSLQDLPPHKLVQIELSLHIIGTWDGNGLADQQKRLIGPDQWGIALVDGPEILHTTFATDRRQKQAFPRPWRTASLPAGTGSTHDAPERADHQYDLSYIVPHTADRLGIRLYGVNLDKDERWAIASVRITLKDEPGVTLPLDKLDTLVDLMHHQTADAAETKAWALVWAGDAAIDPLLKSLGVEGEAAPAKDDPDVRQLIAQLDADQFAEREAAMKKLSEMDGKTRKTLAAALEEGNLSAEQKWRIGKILQQPGQGGDAEAAGGHRAPPPPPTDLQKRRANVLRVLDLINSDASRAAMKRAGLRKAADAIQPGTVFRGTCGQDGYPTFPMQMTIGKVDGKKVEGELYWPTLRGSRSKIRGTLDGATLKFTEYELIEGGGIVIPVDYQGVLTGNAFTGTWSSGKGSTGFSIYLD